MEQSLTNMLKDELRLSEEEAQEKQQRADCWGFRLPYARTGGVLIVAH
jgi:hypothetical protein